MRPSYLLVPLLLAPTAHAADLLSSEVYFGEREARLLVRAAGGEIHVRTEPTTMVAPAPPGGAPQGFVPAPRVLEANHTWRGIENVLEVVLRRTDPREAVDVLIDDGANTGVWLEWPALERELPAVSALVALALALTMRRRSRAA